MMKLTLSGFLSSLNFMGPGLRPHAARRGRRSTMKSVQQLEERSMLSDVFPHMVSINRSTPGTASNASSVSFNATFSESVTGVDAADFSVIVSGSVASTTKTVVDTGDHIHYTVTVGGITGEGTLGVNLVDNGSIRDGVGNGLINPNSAASFAAQQVSATDTLPLSLVMGDINGDGRPDIVTTSLHPNNPGTVSVMTGNSNGTFAAFQTFAVGTDPTSVALGDVNGDGRLDIVVSNSANNNVGVLLRNAANTTFLAQTTIATGNNPNSVALGDVNNDGNLDIVVANKSSNNVGVLLGNGNGTFAAQTTFGTGNAPASVKLGDMNNDGKLDIVVTSSTGATVGIRLRDAGNTTFLPITSFATGTNPNSVAIGDVNNDGNLDVVVANQNSANVGVLIGNGAGGLGAQSTIAAGVTPKSVELGDANGDGKLDIVVANSSSNNVGVIQGNGNGTFLAQLTFAVGTFPSAATLRDVNSDGKPDLIVANQNSNNVSMLPNLLTGPFTGQVYTIEHIPPVFTSPSAVNVSENTTSVVNVTATDASTPLTYSKTGGADAARFTIVPATGVLKFTTAPDFEIPTDADLNNVYVVQITATDGAGNTANQTISVTVTNQGDAPTNIQLSSSSVAENVLAGTAVGNFLAVDQDSGDTHTFEFAAGAGDVDNGKFLIDGGTLKTSALVNFETQSSYSIRVRATDQNLLIFEKQLTITVIDMPEWSFSGGVLTVPGTEGNDVITVLAASGTIKIIANGIVFETGLAPAGVNHVVVSGLGGNDKLTLAASLGASLPGTLLGGNGNDGLFGGLGNDILDGGADNDLLNGGLGADSFDGGNGNDALTIDNADTSVIGGAGSDKVTFGGVTQTAAMTFNLVAAGVEAVAAPASTFNNTITAAGAGWNVSIIGGSGNDTITGGNGNDVLNGGGGNDVLDGGAGNDRYDFNTNTQLGSDSVTDISGIDQLYFVGSTAAVSVNLGVTTAQIVNANLTLTLNSAVSLESAYGGSGDDILIGNSLNNTLLGNAGNDVLSGGDGIDALSGGVGENVLIGGNGLDTLTGGSSEDLMLGARYTLETDTTALLAILNEWTSGSESPFSDRVDHLLGILPGGANGSFTLTSATVKEDSAKDTLRGGSGTDWYLRNNTGATVANRDTVIDADLDSVFTEISTWI